MTVDPNNQHYYDLGAPQPAPLPWFRQRAVLVRLGLGAVVAVVVGLVGFYVYQLVTFNAEDAAQESAAEAMLSEAEARCATDPDPEGCMNKARTETAQTTGSAAACKGLADQELKNCAQQLAVAARDPGLCGVVDDSGNKTSCEDSAFLAKAQERADYGVCASISSAELRASCEAQLLGGVIEAGECAKYGVSDDVCSFPERLAAVVAAGDPTGCAAFTDLDRDSCEDAFTSIDGDGDGLNRLREYQLGTSDNNADTDGDGYSDGQEVATGHDPLK